METFIDIGSGGALGACALPQGFAINKEVPQGRWKHSNLGARHDEGTFSLRKRAFSKNKKGTSLFIAKSWGHVPPVPTVPTSMEVPFLEMLLSS